MQLISRAGTGVNGSSSSPISITFKFAPSVVIPIFIYTNMHSMLHASTSNGFFNGANMSLLTTSFTSGGGTSDGVMQNTTAGGGWWRAYAKKSSDGKTLYWYGNPSDGSTDGIYLYNASGTSYFLGIS